MKGISSSSWNCKIKGFTCNYLFKIIGCLRVPHNPPPYIYWLTKDWNIWTALSEPWKVRDPGKANWKPPRNLRIFEISFVSSSPYEFPPYCKNTWITPILLEKRREFWKFLAFRKSFQDVGPIKTVLDRRHVLPVPEKMRLEMVIRMQTKILDGHPKSLFERLIWKETWTLTIEDFELRFDEHFESSSTSRERAVQPVHEMRLEMLVGMLDEILDSQSSFCFSN